MPIITVDNIQDIKCRSYGKTATLGVAKMIEKKHIKLSGYAQHNPKRSQNKGTHVYVRSSTRVALEKLCRLECRGLCDQIDFLVEQRLLSLQG